jgi:hypothetical protein
VKVKMKRTAGEGFGCDLLEGQTGEVSMQVGEKLVQYGIAEHIPDPPKPPPPVETEPVEPVEPKPEVIKAIPEEPAIANAKPLAVQSAKPQHVRKAPHQHK